MSKAPVPEADFYGVRGTGSKVGNLGVDTLVFSPTLCRVCSGRGALEWGGGPRGDKGGRGQGVSTHKKAKKIKGPRGNNSSGSYCGRAQTLWQPRPLLPPGCMQGSSGFKDVTAALDSERHCTNVFC